jgi:Divergent InlB B-repeat domain
MWNCRILALGMFVATAPFSWSQDQSNPLVVKASERAFAPPLSQLAPRTARPGQSVALADDEDGMRMHAPRAAAPVQDAVLQAPALVDNAGLAALSTNAGLNILGVGTGFPGYSQQAIVPDTNGAVGPTQFVQWANDSFAVFNKSDGSVAYGPATGNTLWQALGGRCAANPVLDGVAQFDKLANRWVMMMPILDGPTYICVAVSTTPDAANGGWNLYAFLLPVSKICNCRLMPDYPKLGVWPDGYYITYNQGYNLVFQGDAACVLDRNSMLNGVSATMQCFTNISPSYGGLLPADLDGSTPPPAGSPNYLLNFDYGDQSLDLWQFHVDWTTPANTTFTGPMNIPVAPFTEACGEQAMLLNQVNGACIPQAGTAQMLDSYGDRVMYRLAYRNFSDHESLVVNHTVTIGTGSNPTGIRWYELQQTQGNFGVYQQGTYAPDSSYRWMGSIAMDKLGDIALGYSVSSAAMSPSIAYTGRVPSDPLGQMESEIDLLSGPGIPHGPQTRSIRWGDYSSMAIDPTDDCTFWYTTQYEPPTGSRWSTRIASFSFPSCTNTSQNTLTVNQVGQGTVTSTDGQINCTNGSGGCSAVYAQGTSVILRASAASGWTFAGWSGPCTGGNPCNLVMNSNLGPTATFTQPSYTLTVNSVGLGTVTSTDGKINCVGGTGACSAAYTGGTSVTMNATPASGWAFSGWSGICSGGNPCSIVMNSNFGPTATFSRLNYTLAVNEVGQGTVSSTDAVISCTNGSGSCSAPYPSGSAVSLNATAASGWTFGAWSGPCKGSNPCNLLMNSNLSPTVTFTNSTAWTLLNKTSNGGSPITSLTIPASGSGHLIAIAIMFNGKTSVASVSDNAPGGGNNYVSAGARSTVGLGATEIWYAVNSNPGATVVTPTFVGSPTRVLITVWEVSGISTLPPDATNISSGNVVLNNTPGPPVTTTQTGDFIVSAIFTSSTSFSSISSGNEFTNDFRTFGDGWAHITSNSAAAGTHQASWLTAAPSGIYCASTVAFRTR